MTTVTFSKDEYGDYVASTGERIGKYEGSELWGRGSSGWYVTEVNGEFWGVKHDSLKEAKHYIIRRHNIMQLAGIVLEESAKTLAKYSKVGA